MNTANLGEWTAYQFDLAIARQASSELWLLVTLLEGLEVADAENVTTPRFWDGDLRKGFAKFGLHMEE